MFGPNQFIVNENAFLAARLYPNLFSIIGLMIFYY
jgi:hypothetical protein